MIRHGKHYTEIGVNHNELSDLGTRLYANSSYCIYRCKETNTLWVANSVKADPFEVGTWEDVNAYITADWVADENGNPIYYPDAVALMDNDICSELHNKIAPCTDQEFYTAYCAAHEEKYNEKFEVM